MEDKLIDDLQVELTRVAELPLEEQPEAFAAIRDQLEIALDAPTVE